MPLVRRIAALAFLAVWLPALLHCRLEAAGILFESDCCNSATRSTEPAADHGCADDLCEVAEGVFTRPDDLSAGTALVSVEFLGVPLVEATLLRVCDFPGELTIATTAPPGLSRPWALRVPGTTAPQAP